MGPNEEKIILPTDATKLGELRGLVRELGELHGVESSALGHLVLAIDEATANVIEHAAECCSMPIEVNLRFGPRDVVAEIIDGGRAFDPCAVSPTTPIGRNGGKRGYGLYLIRRVSRDLSYSRQDEKNVLTLTVPTVAGA